MSSIRTGWPAGFWAWETAHPDRAGRTGLRRRAGRADRRQDRQRRPDPGRLPRADAGDPQDGPDRQPARDAARRGGMKEQLAKVDDKQLDRLQAIIRGMTPAERADPKIINASRRQRIARGSGVTVSDVNELVERFFEARKMMQQMAGQFGSGPDPVAAAARHVKAVRKARDAARRRLGLPGHCPVVCRQGYREACPRACPT